MSRNELMRIKPRRQAQRKRASKRDGADGADDAASVATGAKAGGTAAGGVEPRRSFFFTRELILQRL